MSSYDMFNRRAVFIDRDGTIVQAIQRKLLNAFTAPWDISELVFAPRVKDGMRLLKQLDFLRIMVTNQPDVAYRHLTQEQWQIIQQIITGAIEFDDVFMCRHPRNDPCFMRKPAPGMLLAAADKHGIKLSASYMIGDTDSDTEAGFAAGCRTILIETEYNRSVIADYCVPSFWAAATLIERLEGGSND